MHGNYLEYKRDMSQTYTSDEHERLALNPEARVDIPRIRQQKIAEAVQNLAAVTPEEVVAEAEAITRDAAEFAQYDVAGGAERILQAEMAAEAEAVERRAEEERSRMNVQAHASPTSYIHPAAKQQADPYKSHIDAIQNTINKVHEGV